MSLFQFNIKSRIELETRVLAAALKQSFELGDNDGVSLAHRQLSLLLKENNKGNGGTTGTSTTTESPALPEEEVLTGEDNGAHSEKEDDNGDGGHFESPLPTPEVEFSDVPLPSRDEWGRVARTFESYQFDENGELLKAEKSVPLDLSRQEAADNAEPASASEAEDDTTYDTTAAEPAADPPFEPPALAFEYTNFSAQILDQERSGENPIVEAVDEIAGQEGESEKIAAAIEHEFEPEFPIEELPTEAAESEEQTDEEFDEESIVLPDEHLPAEEPWLPYSADQSTVELSSEAAVQAAEPESEESEPIAAEVELEVESELDQAGALAALEANNKPQPYEIAEAFPSQNLADLSRLSQTSGNLLTDMQAQALAAPSFYNPPLLDPPSKGWAVTQVEDVSAASPSLDQSVQLPADDEQPAAAAIEQPPVATPAIGHEAAAHESFAPEEAIEKVVETAPPPAPNVVRKEAPTRNLFEQMQQFEVPVEVDRPKGYEYDLVSQSGTYLIPEDLPSFSSETLAEATAPPVTAPADAPPPAAAPATAPPTAVETPTPAPGALNPIQPFPSPGGPLGKTNARQTFTRLPQPPQPPPPAPPVAAVPAVAATPAPPPAVPDLGLPRLAQPKPLPHLQEEVSPLPPVEMPENMYALLSVSQMSPQRDIHKSCLRKTRKVLRALKGKAKPERDVLLRELRRLWIAHDILVDPVTRTDYDFRELGLRGAEASPIALPDDSHSSQLGSRTPLRVGELLQCAGLLETAELEIACDMHKAMPEVQFGTFLVKQGFIQERDLDSVLLGQQLLREGKITVAQFQVAMELSQSRGVPISETLIEHGYLREEDLKPDEPPEQNLVPPDAVPTVREVPLRPKAQELVRAELNQGKTVPTWKDQLDWSKPIDEAAASDGRTPEKQSLGNLLGGAPETAEQAQKAEPVFSWKDQFDWEKPAEYAQVQEVRQDEPATPASAWHDQFDWSKPEEYATESPKVDDAVDSGNESQAEAPRKKAGRKKDDGKKDKRKKQPKK